jgi:glycosyltransferase involved in cell wall biosynthesis
LCVDGTKITHAGSAPHDRRSVIFLGSMPRVSVCIPTFDRAEMLKRAISSILAQTFGDFEIVISFDAGPCQPDDVLSGFKDPRIRAVRQPSNLGILGNFNACINESRGAIIKPLGDDDELAPRCLESVDLASRTVDLVTVRNVLWRGTAPHGWPAVRRVEFVRRAAGLSLESLKVDCISPTNLAFSRKLWERLGPYSSSVGMTFDYDFAVRAYAESDSVFINTPLCLFRHWAESETCRHPRPFETRAHMAAILDQLSIHYPTQGCAIASRSRLVLADTALAVLKGACAGKVHSGVAMSVLLSAVRIHRRFLGSKLNA